MLSLLTSLLMALSLTKLSKSFRSIAPRSMHTALSVSTQQRLPSVQEQISAQSMAAAATVAAAAVNAAVGMRTLEAPDVVRSYVYKDGAADNRTGVVDEYGLPLIYDKILIQEYWKKQGSALSQRWGEFLRYSIPFLTKVLTIVVGSGAKELANQGGELARDARIIMEKLGPTYIKLGQMMSVRPDVLPKEALQELKYLQDSVKPFETTVAIAQIEAELGGKLGTFFSEISEAPVAAASLAQVYKAKLASTGEYVAIKVQRPRVLETVSKDLYVLRRAAEVYQGLMDRFAPQQRTNYVALLNEWAVGFYTELDFLNEASNQMKVKELLTQEGVSGMRFFS
jgi:aarF domain-containing kinase